MRSPKMALMRAHTCLLLVVAAGENIKMSRFRRTSPDVPECERCCPMDVYIGLCHETVRIFFPLKVMLLGASANGRPRPDPEL